jgi:quercetin dioxygenase-like cupin family protein
MSMVAAAPIHGQVVELTERTVSSFLALAHVKWKLEMGRRDLDSNIIRLPPSACIGAHVGPEVDVLLLVLDGTGQIITELTTLDLHPGALVWLPQRSRRQFTAGPQGLSYLTVHPRRQSLLLASTPPGEQ